MRLNARTRGRMAKGKPTSLSDMAAVLFLLAANLAVFLPAMRGDFIWDDRYFVSQNQHILGPHFLSTFLFTPYGGAAGFDENSLVVSRVINFYRPFTSLSYWLDYQVWGLNSAAFHLSNILIHAAAAILIYLILKVIGWSNFSCLAASAWFSFFPPHFENVAWISGRTDLLSFFFGALSIFFFILYLKNSRFYWLVSSSLFYLFSLFSKETALSLPLLFFLTFFWQKKSLAKGLVYSLVYLPSFLLWFLLRRWALGGGSMESTGRTLGQLFSTIGFYVSRTIFPFHLSLTVDSQRVFENRVYFFVGLIFCLSTLVLTYLFISGKGSLFQPALFAVAYLLLLLPSAVVIFFPSTVSYIAWRFLYWPSAVAIVGLVYCGKRWLKKRYLKSATVIVIAFFYVLEIYPRAALFGHDEKGFWLGIKNVAREDILARFNIGINYLDTDEAKALDLLQAILNDHKHHLHDVWEVRIYEELAEYYTLKKRFHEAEKYFDKLFQLRPVQSQHTYFNYAYFLGLQGKKEAGEKYIYQMLSLFPQNHLVLIHAAKFYLLLKDYRTALIYLQKDYDLFPNPETGRLLREVEALAAGGEKN